MEYRELANLRLKQTCEFIPIVSRQDWLELRKLGIGGSDVAGIFNVSPFTDKRKVYLSKMEGFAPEELNNSAIDFGNEMEDLIFKMFAVKYKNVYACLSYKDILFRNYFIEYFQASLDGVLVDRLTNEVGILEIKTVQPSAINKWYDNEGNPITPIYYLYQVLHYLNVTGLDFVVVYTLANVENNDCSMRFLQPRRYDRYNILEELEMVKNKCIDFWVNNVQALDIPGIVL
jgi:putative phage-type endonuclease